MRRCLTITLLLLFISFNSTEVKAQLSMGVSVEKSEKVLRHVVLFNFYDSATDADIKEIEDAFSALPSKIPEILDFEWGLNNSPEGLDKGFTHCYFITFADEEGRSIYLPHPDHVAFTEIVGPHLEDVLVVDYWSE